MTNPWIPRLFRLFLALTVTGLTGFLHPVLCLEGDGRVRLEMDASRCCARPAVPLPASETDLAVPRISGSGCDGCTDIHFSNQGTPPPAGHPDAWVLPGCAGAPASVLIVSPDPYPPPGSLRFTPIPPSNLRC